MTRRSRLGTPGLLARHFAVDRASSVLLALLVGVAVLVVAIVPRLVAGLATAELQNDLAAASPLQVDLTANGRAGVLDLSGDAPSIDDVYGATDVGVASFAARQTSPLRDLMGPGRWVIGFGLQDVETPPSSVRAIKLLSLTIDPKLPALIRYVAGAAPARWTGESGPNVDPATQPPIDIAISSDAASQLGLNVGDLVGDSGGTLRVTGVYDIIDPDDAYWVHVPELAHASAAQTAAGLQITAGAVIDPLSAIGMPEDLYIAHLRIWYPTDASSLDYADLPALHAQIRVANTLGLTVSNGQQYLFLSRLPDILDTVRARVTSVTALLALTASGPLGVLFAVLSLGVRTVIDRRRPALALASARGAGALQLRGAMLLEGVLLAVPIGVLAMIAAALLIPARVGPEALVLPVIVTASVPALFAATTPARGLRSGRTDITVRGRLPFRWIVEVAIIGLAAVAVYLLARRGLVESSAQVGVDPLLAATPLLLALAACVIVLRIYPLPLLALQRRMRRRRGAAGMLGASRAVREPGAGFLGVLAIVVGASAAVFSLVMAATLGAGQLTAARQDVGADIRVEAPLLSDQTVAQLRAEPGVAAAAALGVTSDIELVVGFEDSQITVVQVDPKKLLAARPDLAAYPGIDRLGARAGEPVPYLASADLAARLHSVHGTLAGSAATRVGILPTSALPDLARSWILVDAAAAQRVTGDPFEPVRLLVATDPGADIAGVAHRFADIVTAAQGDAGTSKVEVVDTATTLGLAGARPTTGGIGGALLVDALIALVLGVLAIVLTSIAATAARNRLMGVLRLLGMSPGQLGRVIAWELAPIAIIAIVVGTLLGVGLAFLVTRILDLRAFVGGIDPVALDVPWALVGLTSLGFAAMIVATGLIAVAIGRRADPARTVKMGAE